MYEPTRFRRWFPLFLGGSVVTLLVWPAVLTRADDAAVTLASNQTNLVGQADVRILGSVRPPDPAASIAIVHMAQRGAPLPLPESGKMEVSDDGTEQSDPPAGPGQDRAPQGLGTQNAAPQNSPPQPGELPPAPPPRSQVAPAQKPLPLRPGEAQEIDGGWKPIGAVTFASQLPPGELPQNLAASRFARAGEIFAGPSEVCNDLAYTYYWESTSFCCGPLYFEEPNLERYGYTHGILQPIISGAHFFATVPLLPYKMVVHPPHECVYTLGYYRPGDHAPRQRVRDPFRLDAAAIEAALVVGIFLAVP